MSYCKCGGLVILAVVVYSNALAQEKDLVAENHKTHQQILLPAGMIVHYKIRRSVDHEFEKGTLIAFTDSTVSVENSYGHEIKILLIRDLAAIKVQLPHGEARSIAGYTFIAFSGITLVGALTAPKDDLSQVGAFFGVVLIALPSFLIGRSFLKPKKLNLNKSWELKTQRRED